MLSEGARESWVVIVSVDARQGSEVKTRSTEREKQNGDELTGMIGSDGGIKTGWSAVDTGSPAWLQEVGSQQWTIGATKHRKGAVEKTLSINGKVVDKRPCEALLRERETTTVRKKRME